METANRIIIVAAAVLWIWLLVVIILLTWTAPETSLGWAADLVTFLRNHTDALSRTVFSLALAILILLAVALIITELAPPPSPEVKVTNVRAGEGVLSTDEIAQRLARDLLALEQVTDVKARVQSRDKGVQVALDLGVDPQASLADVGERAAALARESVEGRMGVTLTAPPKLAFRFDTRMATPRPPVEVVRTEEKPPPSSPS